MRLAVMAVLAGLFVALSGIAEAQEKRVALIIGNDAYKGLPKLNNAVADARAMDKKLKELGFETIVRTNAGRTDMGRAISEFGRKIGTPDTVGLVFYSGHGIQAFERNWLVPVDASLESEDDLQTEAVDAQRILAAMDEARNPLNIVILDACRDNPLPKKGRSAARGLAVVSVAPRGSVIAYSASPNRKADDGNPGSNGVYTAELLKALDEPGLTVEQVLKRANGGVQRATGGRQVPWFNASIQGDFYFRPGAPGSVAAPAPSAPAPAVDPAAIELAFWDSIKNSADVADFEEYLNQYPRGRFAGLARNKVRALAAEKQSVAVTTRPPSRDPQTKPVQPSVGTYDNSNESFLGRPGSEVVIAVAGPMSGPYAEFGEQLRRGAEFAVAELNRAGGINRMKVRLEIGDDACDPNQAVAVANSFASKKVNFVVGHFCSGSSIPAAEVYAAAGILQITPASTNPRLTDYASEKGWQHVFRTCGRDDQQGVVAANYILKNFGGKRVAILHDRSAYGAGLASSMKASLNASNGREAIYETISQGDKNFGGLIARMKSAAIDVIFFGGYHTEAALLIRQARELGLTALMISGDALVTDEFWKISGPAGQDTLMIFGPDPRRHTSAREVVEKFRASGYDPQGYTLYTYAAVQVWVQAVNAARSFRVSDAARRMRESVFGTVLGNLSFDAKGDRRDLDYVFYVWRNGRYYEL